MTEKEKKRLDLMLVEKGMAPSRQAAQSLIMAGQILVNDHPVDKPGARVDSNAIIVNRNPEPLYVSRGGLKLAHALDVFGISPTGPDLP
jgi:23S rRNA (cytidine1920-2'-O)/16S rRNA (cytidine1409-2'-O)-methyltransferase